MRGPGWVVSGCIAAALLLTGGLPARADYKPLTRQEQEKINQAIDKGVAYLKRIQMKNGKWPLPRGQKDSTASSSFGYTLLPALTLLECGVPSDDAAIGPVASQLRRIHRTLRSTYEVSLALLLLDRLGDARDEEVIRELALRLIAAQCYTGGWNYGCTTMDKAHKELLWKALQDLPADGTVAPVSGAAPVRNPKTSIAIPPALKRLAVFQSLDRFDQEVDAPDTTRSRWSLYTGLTDNSNTQFALLALWSARRHHVPLERTFRRAVLRFQRSQRADGTWHYRYPYWNLNLNVESPAAMTTVGLLGLAIGHGSLSRGGAGREGVRPYDPQIVKGFAALGKVVGQPGGEVPIRRWGYYFLWSVERVSVLYQTRTIAGEDWYRWGVDILLTSQKADGHWPIYLQGPREGREDTTVLGPAVNTCFALLFLKRTNFTKDLTTRLPFKPEALDKSVIEYLRNPPNSAGGTPASQSRKDR